MVGDLAILTCYYACMLWGLLTLLVAIAVVLFIAKIAVGGGIVGVIAIILLVLLLLGRL